MTPATSSSSNRGAPGSKRWTSPTTASGGYPPDIGPLTIRYMPREKCLELKSLKEYLFTYRNLGIFQENIVNQVLDDVVKATDPVWAKVVGDFRPRGGISTIVEATYPRPENK